MYRQEVLCKVIEPEKQGSSSDITLSSLEEDRRRRAKKKAKKVIKHYTKELKKGLESTLSFFSTSGIDGVERESIRSSKSSSIMFPSDLPEKTGWLNVDQGLNVLESVYVKWTKQHRGKRRLQRDARNTLYCGMQSAMKGKFANKIIHEAFAEKCPCKFKTSFFNC